jgi:hypothetical protein
LELDTITESYELLEYISMKDDSEYKEYAEKAFVLFCSRFSEELQRKTEIICKNWRYDSTVALTIVNCTFARAFKYPSFKKEKAKVKDINKAILLWLFSIAKTQLVNFHYNNTCYKPTQEEDLSIIYSVDEMINYRCGDCVERKRDLRIALEKLESLLSGFNEKKRIIYLTYKTYERIGKYPPRSIVKQLRIKLDLSQASLRKYKGEVDKYIKENLSCQK